MSAETVRVARTASPASSAYDLPIAGEQVFLRANPARLPFPAGVVASDVSTAIERLIFTDEFRSGVVNPLFDALRTVWRKLNLGHEHNEGAPFPTAPADLVAILHLLDGPSDTVKLIHSDLARIVID